MTTCHKCGKLIQWDEENEDWYAEDGTACSGDVTYDSNGDPVIGRHEPDDDFLIASELGFTGFDPTPWM
jgi:hypothetical protein